MEAVLRRLSIWDTVSDPIPAINERSYQWEERNLLARSEIHFACEPPQQIIIRGLLLAKDAWDSLRTTYNTKTFVEVKHMCEAFEKMSKLPSESCTQWIRRVRDTAAELDTYVRPVGDEDIAYKLLSGLLDEYRALRTALMAWRTDTSKLDVIRISSAILIEEKSIRSTDTSPTTSAPSSFAHIAHSSTAPASSVNVSPHSLSIQPQFAPSQFPSQFPFQFPPQFPSYTPRRFERRRNPFARCTFCRSNGHYETTCFLKFPELRPHHPHYPPRSSTSADHPSTSADSVASLPNPPAASPAIPHPAPPKQETAAFLLQDPPHPDVVPNPLLELAPKFEYNYSSASIDNVGHGSMDWLLDSGCSAHYTKWTRCFREFCSLKKPITVGTGGGNILGWAAGSVPLDISCGTVLLENIIFTPT